jgi:hypothetical protein
MFGVQEAGMTAVTRFEDLIAWQEARKLEQMIYKISNEGIFAKFQTHYEQAAKTKGLLDV